MSRAYYNELDPFAAEWLRHLIERGLIAPGDVDERSIEDVTEDDLHGYTQVHLFAGIGGWSYALRLAGWPDDRSVWTGSCPCQPFSSAGKRQGDKDPRHLWPHMYRLIAKCRPPVVFGEQVDRAIAHGWLDGISADLEKEGYAVGSAVLGSHSVGSPCIGQRLYWVATADSQRAQDEGLPAATCATATVHGEVGQQRVRTDPWQRSVHSLGHDGRRRRLPPGLVPLAHGIPARVVRLRGYGNSINPYIAAEFISTYQEAHQ